MGALSEAVANHLPTLIAIGLHDPGIIAPTPDGCALADSLDVPRERFERWSFEKSEADLLQLLATFETDRILDVLRSIFGQTPLTTALADSHREDGARQRRCAGGGRGERASRSRIGGSAAR